MAFTWSASGVGYSDRRSEMLELQTNINIVYDNIDLTHYGWSEIPPPVSTYLQRIDILEVRSALDRAHNNNYCRTQDVSQFITIYNSLLSAVDSANYAPYYSGYLASDDSNKWNAAWGPY